MAASVHSPGYPGTSVPHIDGFVVDSVDGHITHLVLRKGPPWRRKNVTVPVAQIESIGGNVVHLKLEGIGVEALPAIPVRAR